MMPHLFVDISSHGFGHLAQTGPVLDALAAALPALRLTIRSGLPISQLRQRINAPFNYIAGASDVAFLMHDALRLDREASAKAWRDAHRDWPAAIEAEADLLRRLTVTAVLSNVSPLPLAGAKQAGLPAVAMCSLHWCDQFSWLFDGEDWAMPIAAQLQAAYGGADAFLRLRPGMPMPMLSNIIDIPPIAHIGRADRTGLAAKLGSGEDKLVLIAMGGVGFSLDVSCWPEQQGVRYLLGEVDGVQRDDIINYRALSWHFSDLLASVDAIVTKPGYGIFVEAAACATPLLYLRRADWPEQEVLIDWLQSEASCGEVSATALSNGALAEPLQQLWRQPRLQVAANGAALAAAHLVAYLKPGSQSA